MCETWIVKKAIAMANVADLLRIPTSRSPEDVAIIDGACEVSWEQLTAVVDAIGRGLAGWGLFGGHRVALALANSAEFVATYLAVLRAGMVAVPLNPTSTAREFATVLADCGARAVVADGPSLPAVRRAVAGLDAADDPVQPSAPVIVAVGTAPEGGGRSFDELAAATGPDVSTPPDPEGLAVLLYTSGTSGRPRAAMLSHRALLANVEQAGRIEPPLVQPGDVVLGALPMFHVYGLNAVLGPALHHAATIVLGRRFDPDETLDLIAHHHITCVPVAPPVIAAWGKRSDVGERLRAVRVLLSGAAPLDADLVNGFEAATGVRIEQGYGLTEASPIVTCTLGTPVHKPGSVGRAIPGVDLRVVDDAGNDVGPDDPGEIWARGDNLFSGYWPDRDADPGPDGWLATGDVGFLDPDGDLFLVDRLKEVVIVSGFNVYPAEVEEVIADVDGVAACAVVGVPAPGGGEEVVAIVVPAATVDNLDRLLDRVRSTADERLARFKHPARIEIASELPYSVTGKVAKGRLRAMQARRARGLA